VPEQETDFDVVIRGATVSNATSTHVADVGVKAGRIAGVAAHLPGRGASEIDGAGKVLVPGGIDPHTHFATPSPDGTLMSADDYESGTRAAAAGGVTTIINYAFQRQGESLAAALDRERAKADGHAHIDYAFHPILTDLRGGRSLHELTGLVAAGYPSVKIFTTYDPFRVDDREAIAVLAAAGKAGAPVTGLADHVDHFGDGLVDEVHGGVGGFGDGEDLGYGGGFGDFGAAQRVVGRADPAGGGLLGLGVLDDVVGLGVDVGEAAQFAHGFHDGQDVVGADHHQISVGGE